MKKCFKSLLGLSFLGSLFFTGDNAMAASTGSDKVYEFKIPVMDKAPVLDGKMAPGEWAKAAGFDGMVQASGKGLDERVVRSYVGATETDFYIALESELPPGGADQLVAKVKKNISKAVFDDSFEVFINPTPGAKNAQIFQMLFNSLGKGCYLVHTIGAGKDIPGWDGKIQMSNGFTENTWVTEVRIPIERIAPNRKATDGSWGISVCRDWKNPWSQASAPGGFKGSNTKYTFTNTDSLVVKQLNLTDPFTRKIKTKLFITNPMDKPLKIKAAIDLERNSMPTVKKSKDFDLAAGGKAEFLFEHEERNSDAFGLLSKVTSADGKTVYYEREVKWGKPRKKRWDMMITSSAPVDFNFAYYPYLNKMKVKLDWSGLKKGAVLDKAKIVIRKQWTDKVLKEIVFDGIAQAKGKELEKTIDVPDFDGKYEMALTAEGKGTPVDPVVKTFVRKHYPWEGNKLGKSNKVYPPFTDMAVDGKVIKTVLREHTVNNLGLPSQIKAKGRDLLAGDVEFKAVIDGQEVVGKASDLVFQSQTNYEVKTGSDFTIGKLAASAEALWDYDGTLKYELTLKNSGGAKVDSLDLVVPLKSSEATMIHAMIEGLRRGPISEFLPKDQDGVIWTSKELLAGDMPKGFCTYIFLGTPLRGLSWFAENDLNWSWDRKTPNIELERKGDQLLMKIHLINIPVVIDKPRKITFGMLAAPVKPRLKGWRDFWWTRKCTVLGTSINWLAGPGVCGNVYPAGKDPYFWRMLAKANTGVVPKEEIKECIERGLKYFEPFEMRERWVRHVNRNVGGARHGMTQVFYYNRATTATDEEYATFLNEWRLDNYPTHEFKVEPWEIKIVPSESYIDFALYWYAKSFEYGRNLGVYWDNWYLRPSFNTMMTDAYMKDGEIVPATGLWGLRELCKRTFVMMNEKGMVPITMPHMTSTNILPMHSFATVQYDWEWKYSTGDVQYRHSREYLQLVSNGELAGLIPVPLNDHGKEAKDEWVQRTFAGVSLLHELETGGSGSAWKTLRDPLIPIMQNPDLKAWRYWDEEKSPVSSANPDLPSIVYCAPGKEAMVLFCSYSEKDEDAIITIDPKALELKADGLKVINYETGKALKLDGNKLKLKIKKHDVLGIKISN